MTDEEDSSRSPPVRRRSLLIGTQTIKCFVDTNELAENRPDVLSNRMRPRFKKRLKWSRILVTAIILIIGHLGLLGAISYNVISVADPVETMGPSRRLLESTEQTAAVTTAAPQSGGEYPPDLFSLEQRRQGAVILHVFGMLYMFVALALVCDEFFVPSLEVITEKLDISEDVAGATFMAAGGSAPELFTSIIGVFLARSNVGIGTIVGSAVFNILFVIGICALASKTVLHLTWWPLFRDVTFYSIDLVCLICFFLDGRINWWEALIQLSLYAAYVIFMKYNFNIERFVKSKIRANKVKNVDKKNGLIDNKNTQQVVALGQNGVAEKKRPPSTASILRGNSSRFRQGMLQLLIHTIDPIGDAKVDEKAVKLHAIASLKVLIESDPCTGGMKTKYVSGEPLVRNGSISTISSGQVTRPVRNGSTETSFTAVGSVDEAQSTPEKSVVVRTTNVDMTTDDASTPDIPDSKAQEPELEEAQPLDLSWPDKWHKRITYILVMPIVLCLWITLPDVRRPSSRKWFPVTFIVSICWIMGFSYLMVWWAALTGETIGISDEIMGLTILAAGTSIPDLITSVIVARKGFGDMAVSSSVGSNIFDVTVGLPFPWLLYFAVFQRTFIGVDSAGLFCSIVLLFMMLVFVIAIIAIFQWRMNKGVGGSMLVLYVVFLILSVLLQLNIIKCPVEI